MKAFHSGRSSHNRIKVACSLAVVICAIAITACDRDAAAPLAPRDLRLQPVLLGPGSVLQVSASSTGHTCAVQTNGSVACWGFNGSGQSNVPATLTGVTEVSTGSSHTCALKNDGTVVCWGLNGAGQSSPPAGLTGVTQIEAGFNHNCARKDDGTVVCWGDNSQGQRTIPPGLADVGQISAGGAHTCALKYDTTVVCWGSNSNGQRTPPIGLSSVVQISAGGSHTCVRQGGSIVCWGNNNLGQASAPSFFNFAQVSAGNSQTCGSKTDGTVVCWGSTGGAVPTGLTAVTNVSAGNGFGCALKNDGTVVCWGNNLIGQATPPDNVFSQVDVGNGNSCFVKTDATVLCWGDNNFGKSLPPAGLAAVIRVSTGGAHTCALKQDGTVVCWGSIGPVQSIPAGLVSTQMEVGTSNTCAVRVQGTVVCWGDNSFGKSTPPVGLAGATEVTTGSNHTCALKADGTVVCWGDNSLGQRTPPPGLADVTQVSAGEAHTCALLSNGTVACWGTLTTQPSGLSGVTQISAGRRHTCVLKDDGIVVCWGENGSGQAAPPNVRMKQVSAGTSHTCGLELDDSSICWGTPAVLESDAPPIANAGGPYGGALEGSSVVFDGGGSYDPEGDLLTYAWDFGDGATDNTGATPSHVYADNGTYTVTLAVTEGSGRSATAMTTVDITNAPPVVTSITTPINPIPVSTPFVISASFTDVGTADTHSATIDWDEVTLGGTVDESNGSGSVVAGHLYTSPGVYTITVAVTDDDSGYGTLASTEYVVVYDPNGGFVTGGGWIISPAGAYAADPALTGKASFGFVSKYQKGATIPTGNTEFEFNAASFSFKSTKYDWLVVAGPKGQYKGEGLIAGDATTYAFLLTANDGQVSGGGGIDRFRIKVWNKASGQVIYDNQSGVADDAAATAAIGGGSIVIHSK